MRKLYITLIPVLLFAAAKVHAQATINVVFHVVYNTSAQNIPDSCLQHQLDVLNEDLNAANADLWKVPAAWTPIIGNLNVNLVLASVDPNGNPSTGIERRQYPTTSWSNNDNVKHYASGGLDAWPDTSYLNIWVCNLANGLNGYTQFPGGPAATDGIVLHYRVVGRGSYAMAPFDHGRTATHEFGHWLGLRHFGPDASCADIDNIPDTPPFSSNSIYGSFTPFQVITDGCNPNAPGVMWMNFMTYVNDTSMYFFTQNQVDTMTWVFNNMRQGMGNPLGIGSAERTVSFSAYPSPSSDGIFTIRRQSNAEAATFSVYNMLGEPVIQNQLIGAGVSNFNADLSAMPSGFYSLMLNQNGKTEVTRIAIVK